MKKGNNDNVEGTANLSKGREKCSYLPVVNDGRKVVSVSVIENILRKPTGRMRNSHEDNVEGIGCLDAGWSSVPNQSQEDKAEYQEKRRNSNKNNANSQQKTIQYINPNDGEFGLNENRDNATLKPCVYTRDSTAPVIFFDEIQNHEDISSDLSSDSSNSGVLLTDCKRCRRNSAETGVTTRISQGGATCDHASTSMNKCVGVVLRGDKGRNVTERFDRVDDISMVDGASPSGSLTRCMRVKNWAWGVVAQVNPKLLIEGAMAVHRALGTGFLMMLIIVQLFLKGFLDNLTRLNLLPFFRAMGRSAVEYQRVEAVGSSVWAFRGLVTTISDCIPIFGYHKRYYMLIASVIGITGSCILTFTPPEVATNLLPLVAAGVLMQCAQPAVMEVMVAAKYTEFMHKDAYSRVKIVSFACFCASIGQLCAGLTVGYVADSVGYRPIYYTSVAVTLIPILPILIGMLPEERTNIRVRMDRLFEHKGIFIVAGLVSVSQMTLIGTSIASYQTPSVIICFLILFIIGPACWYLLPKPMARWNIYLLLWGYFNISISGALNFFFTATPTCLPNGPHFDYTYYTGYATVMGTFAEWIGIWLFNAYMKRHSFKCVIFFTSVLRCVSSLFDYMLVTRANVRMGIPDKYLYFLGDAIIQRVLIVLNYLPGLTLTSRLCPEGMHATSYAVMDSISHMAWTVNRIIGAWIVSLTGIRSNLDDSNLCNFDALPSLTLWTQVVLPLFITPICFCLVPGEVVEPKNTAMSNTPAITTSNTVTTPTAMRGDNIQNINIPNGRLTEFKDRSNIDIQNITSISD